MNTATAAARLGIPENEVAAYFDEVVGLIVKTTDGQSYIDVPVDHPDGAGRTGLMFLAAPSATYGGDFPIYTRPADDEAEPEEELTPTTDGLADAAAELEQAKADLVVAQAEKEEAVARAEAAEAALAELAANGDPEDDPDSQRDAGGVAAPAAPEPERRTEQKPPAHGRRGRGAQK